MSYADKNAARRAHQGAAGSADRKRWRKARDARRQLVNGAFGQLNHNPKTQEEYDAFAMFTRGAR